MFLFSPNSPPFQKSFSELESGDSGLFLKRSFLKTVTSARHDYETHTDVPYVLPGDWSQNTCLGFPYLLVALDGRMWSPSFPFSPWPSHYSSSSSLPSLWISHLPLPPPFSLFCPSLFSPLFLSHRISLCCSRCRNSLLHINELLISKAKSQPASQPPASCSQSYTSLSHPLSSSCAFSYSLSHTRSATLFAWWADNWYAEVHGDLSRESGDITNLSESLTLLPVPAALLGGYSQRVHPNKFFQLLRVICSFMDVYTNTRENRIWL